MSKRAVVSEQQRKVEREARQYGATGLEFARLPGNNGENGRPVTRPYWRVSFRLGRWVLSGYGRTPRAAFRGAFTLEASYLKGRLGQ